MPQTVPTETESAILDETLETIAAPTLKEIAEDLLALIHKLIKRRHDFRADELADETTENVLLLSRRCAGGAALLAELSSDIATVAMERARAGANP